MPKMNDYPDIKVWKKHGNHITGKGKYGTVILTKNEMKKVLREIELDNIMKEK